MVVDGRELHQHHALILAANDVHPCTIFHQETLSTIGSYNALYSIVLNDIGYCSYSKKDRRVCCNNSVSLPIDSDS